MNRVQLLYEVVKALRAEEVFQGALQVEARKDQTPVFHLDTEFLKNTITGELRSKIKTEYDYDGKKMKHESSTEANLNDFHFRRPMHPGMMRHWHGHCHPGMFQGPDRAQGAGEPGWGHHQFGRPGGGFKEGLDRAAFMLQLFNNIQLVEEDRTFALSLRLTDIPEELRRAMRERMNQEEIRRHFEEHPHPAIIKALHELEDPDLEINVIINKQYQIEKVAWALHGVQNEDGAAREWDVKAELSLEW